jgi:uncharacterized membrane protein
VKAESETNLSISDQLKLSNKGYKIAVALAIIFVFSLLIGYYFVTRQPPEAYSTIYLLDQQKKAINYPELLVLNNNNTFSVYVTVENHMGAKQDFEVLQKVVNDTIPSFPVEVPVEKNYTQTMENGDSWETLATDSINQTGSYSVIFELWIYDDEVGAYEFSHNYCVLNIEVTDQT